MGLLDLVRQPQGIFDQDSDPEAILRRQRRPSLLTRTGLPLDPSESAGTGAPSDTGAAAPSSGGAGPTLMRPGEAAPHPDAGGFVDTQGPPIVDDRRLRDLYGQLHPEPEPPLDRKHAVLQALMKVAPMLIGGAFGGAAGAGGAAKGQNEFNEEQYKHGQDSRNLLEKEYEAEANREEHQREQQTNMWVNAPYRAAQIEYLNQGAEARKAAAHKSQEQADAGGFAPKAPPKPPAGDEFERIWGNDPKHHNPDGSIIPPTLKDKLAYDKQVAGAGVKPQQPQQSLVIDGEGNVTEAKPGMKLPPGARPLNSGLNVSAQQQTAQAGQKTAINFAQDYIEHGSMQGPDGSPMYTGPGDEALLEKFFEMAKPSSGFRMTQPQMKMVQDARNMMGSLQAKLRHATTGTWFSDEQRRQIVSTMIQIGKAAGTGGAAGGGAVEEWERGTDGKLRRKAAPQGQQ